MSVRAFVVAAVAPLIATGALHRADSCLKLGKAGTQVQGIVRVCPGHYRIADPKERGVLIVVSSGSRIDLSGVTLESGDTLPSDFVGTGVVLHGVDSVTVKGGRIRGYRFGVRVEGGQGHHITSMDLSGSRQQALRSTTDRYDEGDWLDIFHPDTFETYGAGLYLLRAEGVVVTGVVARGAQNGIGLFETRMSTIADNDVSDNSGWGIHLWRASRNVITRNKADHNLRCESPSYSRGCDSAALLLRQRSDSNLISDNDLSWSGDGFFLSGHRPLMEPSIANVVVRNNASFAFHNAFESTFSEWNVFVENRADSAEYGFWLGYSRSNSVERNSIIGSRMAGIAIEHGGDNGIAGNVIIGGRYGIRLFAPHEGDEASEGYRVDDNTIAMVEQGIVLERTVRTRLRGNLFDGVDDALIVDAAGADASVSGNVFLRVRRWFVRADSLDAGGNFWATRSLDSTATMVQGRVNLRPWRPASAAGY